MRSLKSQLAVVLLLAFLLPFTSCKKDEAMEEMVIETTSLELDQETLLSDLSDPESINFFDLTYIERTNPNLEGLTTATELDPIVEEVYLDFLIKNGAVNFVPGLIQDLGYPMWQRIQTLQSEDTDRATFLIPFVTLAGDKTNAVMVAIPMESDEFYQERNLDRPGYFYLSTTREQLREALESYPKLYGNTYNDLGNFLLFDRVIFDYVNEDWQRMYDEYDDGFAAGDEKGICSHTYCLPVAITDGPTEDEKGCISVTYTWECPGTNGGYIPGGGSTNGGSNPSGNGGGSGTVTSQALATVIAGCSSETSPDVIVDNPQYGEDGGNCALLLAAIEYLGIDAFPESVWLQLFQNEPELLELALSIDLADRHIFILYVLNTLSGNTDQVYRAFVTNYRQVEELQAELEFDSDVFQWLLNQAITIPARETSVADEIEDFLAENPGTDAQTAANRYLQFLIANNQPTTNTTTEEATAFLKLQNSLLDQTHLDHITQEQLDFFVEYDDFDTIDGPTDGFFGDFSAEDDEVAPAVVIYILKKAAQAGAGALADIAVQWMFEYYLGDHPDPWVAWQELDVNEWQVLGSAIEAATTGKYAPIVSGMTAGVTYLLSEPEPTLVGFFTNLSVGVIGGFVADNIADYVGALRAAFTKYGFLTPYGGLTAMGIKEGIMQFVVARRALINGIWEDLSLTTTKGFYFEEVLSYSRYRNGYQWVNEVGEQGKKIDFYDPATATGVQLKSSAVDFRNNQSAFNQALNRGANQLRDAIQNGVPGVGNVVDGQLDIMIPPSKAGDVNFLNQRAQTWLATYLSQNPGINITINIGTFYD